MCYFTPRSDRKEIRCEGQNLPPPKGPNSISSGLLRPLSICSRPPLSEYFTIMPELREKVKTEQYFPKRLTSRCWTCIDLRWNLRDPEPSGDVGPGGPPGGEDRLDRGRLSERKGEKVRFSNTYPRLGKTVFNVSYHILLVRNGFVLWMSRCIIIHPLVWRRFPSPKEWYDETTRGGKNQRLLKHPSTSPKYLNTLCNDRCFIEVHIFVLPRAARALDSRGG